MDVFFTHLPDIGAGLWVTIRLALISFAGALVIGTVVAIMRISPIAPLRAAGAAYVEFFRNIPLLSLLFLIAFGLPDIGITVSLFQSVTIGIALASAAFVCEAVRTGINTVPLGQAEAARAIGLTFTASLRSVILPQAFRSMVQPLTNVWIGTLIGTSISQQVGVNELTGASEQLQNTYAGGLPLLALSALVYILICLASGFAGARLARRVAIVR